jgi:undecaprenyl-diphosphatase
MIIVDINTNGNPELSYRIMRQNKNFLYYFTYFINAYLLFLIYVLFAFIIIKAAIKKEILNFRFAFFVLLVQLLISFWTVGILKYTLGIPRPLSGEADWELLSIKGHHHAMPSGHTTDATIASGSFVQRKNSTKDLTAFLIGIIPALVGFSRIYVGKHHTLDVMVGAILGSLGIFLAFCLMKRLSLIGDIEKLMQMPFPIEIRAEKDYDVIMTNDTENYWNIFENYYDRDLAYIKLVKNDEKSAVSLINTGQKIFVFSRH